jgi:hypothetical protein
MKDTYLERSARHPQATSFRKDVLGLVQRHMSVRVSLELNAQPPPTTQSRWQYNFGMDEAVAADLDTIVNTFLKCDKPVTYTCSLCLLHHTIKEFVALREEHRRRQNSDPAKQKKGIRLSRPEPNGDRATSYSAPATIAKIDACGELLMALIRAFPLDVFKHDVNTRFGHNHDDIKEIDHCAFKKATDKGLSEIVKYMMKHGLMASPKKQVIELLTDSSDIVHDAVHAYKNNFKTDNCIEILEELLKLEQSVLLGEERRSNALNSEMPLRSAILKVQPTDSYEHSPWLHVVEMILRYRGDLKTTEIIERALERANPDLANMFFSDTQIDERVARKLIEVGHNAVWGLSSVQSAVGGLLKNEEVARELFRLALKKGRTPEVPDRVGTNPPDQDPSDAQATRRDSKADNVKPQLPGFAEDILRLMGRFDADIREDIVKSGSLWFWKLPYVQGLWREEVQKDKNLCMLHVAVQHQKVEMVEYFLKEDPDSVTKQVEVPRLLKEEKGVFALWHNNFVVPDGPESSRAKPRQFVKRNLSDVALTKRSARPNGESGLVTTIARPMLPSALTAPAAANPDSGDYAMENTRKKIHTLLVPAIIERASGMDSLVKILRDSRGQSTPLSKEEIMKERNLC